MLLFTISLRPQPSSNWPLSSVYFSPKHAFAEPSDPNGHAPAPRGLTHAFAEPSDPNGHAPTSRGLTHAFAEPSDPNGHAPTPRGFI